MGRRYAPEKYAVPLSNDIESFHHISMMWDYKDWSPEELRLADYNNPLLKAVS